MRQSVQFAPFQIPGVVGKNRTFWPVNGSPKVSSIVLLVIVAIAGRKEHENKTVKRRACRTKLTTIRMIKKKGEMKKNERSGVDAQGQPQPGWW